MRACLSNHANFKFTESDDNKLRRVIAKIGTNNWKEVTKYFPNRTQRQVKDRWEKFLSPDLNFGPFSIEEDIQILKLYKEYGPKWMQISRMMQNRSDVIIKSRFQKLQRHNESLDNLIEISNKNQQSQTEVAPLKEIDDLISFDECMNLEYDILDNVFNNFIPEF
ncbi:Myb-like DNA-binding domain containing protein [Trichomonas vaginalis G3]|uniref:Myb-like DNA-binding domain containing protein n=1 Tax=Trichomonas vaginalis (strain ATCC PRA-98 / G3) TaxID=412133 RepID=A2DLG2_TRIV3|nr:RNA polymerase II transcription regulator recruiting protein [Trichomonas vaginalis G3]EAY18780.1 Myb-like DNA-binding domain containing protein [Trichomonas vaginalis G3]KAI5539284.1 RNA polymerase II transcription regulator recruiting protein [Trichomonas vaginalis G3]|eukprot:XP_001579766.1 Myb-like DNA-binding domain containing protein [Trichomonas vaginalis G3]